MVTPDLSFEDIYELYGPPTDLYVRKFTNHGEISATMTMIYQEYGMIVKVEAEYEYHTDTFYFDQSADVQSIRLLPVEEVNLDGTGYVIIGDFEKEIPSDYLYEWNGFGSVDELYSKLFYDG